MTPAERLARRLDQQNRHDSTLAQLPREDFPSCGCIRDGDVRTRTCPAHQR